MSLNGLSVQEQMLPLVESEYTLRREGDTLSCDVVDAFDNEVRIVIYDTGRADIMLSTGSGLRVALNDEDDRVDFGDVSVDDSNSERLGLCDIDMDNVDFGVDPADRIYDSEGYFNISKVGGDGSGEFPDLVFRKSYAKSGRSAYSVDDIVIEIPDKEEGSAKSREFLFMLCPRGEAGRVAKISFVDTLGNLIQFVNGD